MGEIVRSVLLTDELLRLIVSFHTNDIIEFFRKDRSDLLFIRGITDKEIQVYLECRIKYSLYNIPQPEIDINCSRSTNYNIYALKDNVNSCQSNYYAVKYKISGLGHDGYCPEPENDEFEPFTCWALIKWTEEQSISEDILTRIYHYCVPAALNYFNNNTSEYRRGICVNSWKCENIIKVN